MRDDLPPSRGSGSFGRSDNFPQDVGFRDMDRGMGRDRRDRGSGGSQSRSGGPGGDRDRDLRSSGGGNLAGTPKEGGCQIFIRNVSIASISTFVIVLSYLKQGGLEGCLVKI